MSIVTLLLTAGFGTLVMVGVPFAIAIASITAICLFVIDLSPALLAQQVIAGSQSFSLLAIPLFMLAGELMTAGGLSKRLIDAAGVLVRHMYGGLAMVAVLSALVSPRFPAPHRRRRRQSAPS